jgi:hypothetical protein
MDGSAGEITILWKVCVRMEAYSSAITRRNTGELSSGTRPRSVDCRSEERLVWGGVPDIEERRLRACGKAAPWK